MKAVLLRIIAVFATAAASAHAAETGAGPRPFACPYDKAVTPERVGHDVLMQVHTELVRRFDDALGRRPAGFAAPGVAAAVAANRIDPRKMAALAEASGCAALFDADGACAQFFDPELGDPLSVIMDMRRSAPLRRQFEDAIAHLARPADRRAAQACIERVGRK